MADPVFTADGQTYERTAIAAWLVSHSTSPLTGIELEHKHLVPNFALKSVIVEMVSTHPEVTSRLGRGGGSGDGDRSSGGGQDDNAQRGRGGPSSATVLPVARRCSLTRSTSTKTIMAQCGVLSRINKMQCDSKAKNVAAAAAKEAASIVNVEAATTQHAAQAAVRQVDFKAHALANRPKARGQVTDFAALTIKAYVAKQQTEIRWRSFREQRCRNAIAWLFNAVMYFICTVMVLAFGVEALGPSVMASTVAGWVAGLLQVFLIVEPLQVLIVTCFPYCIEEDTKCGRCFRRVQWFYNEFLSP